MKCYQFIYIKKEFDYLYQRNLLKSVKKYKRGVTWEKCDNANVIGDDGRWRAMTGDDGRWLGFSG